MTKVLLVTEDYWPRHGGVANYYGGLVTVLNGRVAVLTTVAGDEAGNIFRVNYKSSYIWPRWLSLLWLIPKYLKKSGARAAWAGDILPVGTACWILSKFMRLPYFVSLHGFDLQLTQTSKPRRRWLARRILKAAKFVTVNSQYTYNLIKELIPTGLEILIVYPVAAKLPNAEQEEMDKLKIKYGLADKKILLTVSRLVNRKGIDMVIEAVSSIKAKFPKLYYIIVGGGQERNNLEKLAARTAVPATLVGEVSLEELAAWYSLCDVFILTPKFDSIDAEGYGIVYREAAQFSKPIIASKVGGVPEAAGPDAIYANTPAEITAALDKILVDEKFAKSLGQKINQQVDKVTIETESAKITAALDKL